jgi:PAS domain S-box-containing protein
VTAAKEQQKGEEKLTVLSSISTILAAVQRKAYSEDVYQVLSNELAAHKFFNVIFDYRKEKESPTLLAFWLPESVIKKSPHATLPEKGTPIHAVPLDSVGENAVKSVNFENIVSQILGAPVKDVPSYGVIIPVPTDDTVLLIASDILTDEELPIFSALSPMIQSTLVTSNQYKTITEKKQFAERIIKSVQEGILMEDCTGTITFVNPTVCTMLGYTEDELCGCHYSTLAHSSSVSLVKKETKKRTEGVQSQYEATLQRKDGSLLPVIVSATPLFENGEHIGNLTVFTDRSAQKKAEQEIRSLKEFNENIIQSLHEPVMIENSKGIITFVNPKFEELVEYEQEKIIGNHKKEFIASQYHQKMKEETAKRKQGIPGQYEAALKTHSGNQIPVMIGATPLFEEEVFTGVISICVDLTMVKEKEHEIKQKNEDLQLLSKINLALNKGEDLYTILDMVVEELQTIFHPDITAIMFVEKNKQNIRSEHYAVSKKVKKVIDTEHQPHKVTIPIGKGSILEKAIHTKKEYLVSDKNFKNVFKGALSSETISKIYEHIPLKSTIVVPMVVDKEVIGVLLIGSHHHLDKEDLQRFKGLARHLALAIDHARLDETFQKTSRELQAHLLEQTLLRELVENLYMAQSQEEVVDIVANGLKGLGYHFFAISMRKNDVLHVVKIEPDTLLPVALQKAQELMGRKPHLGVVSSPDRKEYISGNRQMAVVTDNITLHKEKHVACVSMEFLFQSWVGDDIPSEAVKAMVEAMELVSAIVIPFRVADEFWGAFVVGSKTVLEHHDFVVLETLGQIIGEALEKLMYSKMLMEKSQDLEFSNRQLNLLQEITNALNSTMDLKEILKILVSGINAVFKYNTASVYLLSDDKKYLMIKEFDISSRLMNGIKKLVGFPLEDYKIPLFEGSKLKQVIDNKESLVTDDIKGFIEDFAEKESLRRLAKIIYRMSNAKWATAVPLIANDEPVGILAFGSDKKTEQEDIDALSGFLNQAALAIAKARMYEELKEANQMKSEFIDVASHELRTPLTSIKLYLEMILMGRYGEIKPELEEKIKLLQVSSERLQEIIDQTLVSSRIIKEKLELKKEKTSMAGIIQDIINQFKPLWEVKNQDIDVRGPYQVPLVDVDKDAMWKVITALLDNAIKYSPEGSRITIKLHDHPNEIEVAIMDEGIGIQKKFQQKIFEEFFIIPSETEYARMDGRTGLGLFIAKGIIEEHGGKIWVESVYGLGSTFHFTIPK